MLQPNFGVPVIVAPPRVNWQESLEQGFQARHLQRLQNRGVRRRGQNERVPVPVAAAPPVPMEQIVGVFISPQQFMGQQERYAEEEH